MGQLLIFAQPTIEVAAVVGVLSNAVFVMIMGFNPLATPIPAGYEWLYAITPHRYTFALLAGSVFGDCSADHLAQMQQALVLHVNASSSHVPQSWGLDCQLIQDAPPSMGDYVPIKLYIDKVFGIQHDHMTQ